MIGDPTGQSKIRPVLTREQVEANAKTYQEQAFKILDKDPNKIEVVQNSKWLDTPQMLKTLIEISSSVTVDQLLVREDFDKRRKAHRPIAIQEMLYPMLQGYDSVAVKADVELGGTDQTFNLLMGREIQSKFGQKPQVVMTMPLLVGLDGTMKMSKSLGNAVAVNDSSKDMFGKLMSIPDSLMRIYFDLLTNENGAGIAKEVEAGKLHPKEAKKKLAALIVESYYSKAKAKEEAEEFERVFSQRKDPANPEPAYVKLYEMTSAGLLREVKAVDSSSEAYRLIQQGGVTLDGQKIMDPKATLKIKDGSLLRVGKKIFLKLFVKK